jgi:hypothetical protein
MSRKFTSTDWKTIVVGVLLFALFLALKIIFTAFLVKWQVDSVVDYILAIFGSGVLIFTLNELFGRRIIGRLTG